MRRGEGAERAVASKQPVDPKSTALSAELRRKVVAAVPKGALLPRTAVPPEWTHLKSRVRGIM